MVRTLSRDRAGISNWIILLVLVIAVVAILAAYYTYFTPVAAPAPLRVQQGDQIQLDYTGTFQDTGLVFDTSNQSVAKDNATFPKAYSFSWRSSWSPLSFTVGSGTVVTGFDQGVRGLAVGEAKTIEVPYSEGYGPANPALVHVHDLLESVPVRTYWNESAFMAYFKSTPLSGSAIADPVWGWPDLVTLATSYITVTASPGLLQTVHPYGLWNATVVSIDDTANNGTGVIQVQHHLTASLVDVLGATDPSGQKFYLSAVDVDAGKYTLNYNRQVVGRTLIFQVTIVKITRSV